MQADSTNSEITQALHHIAGTLRKAGGYVADDLVVHERAGDFWCSITDRIGEPDRVLVRYPIGCVVPLYRLTWVDDPDVLKPASGLEQLGPVKRELLDAWLVLVNEGQKLAAIRSRVPEFAITEPKLRQHLAAGGYPALAKPPRPLRERTTLIAWHSMLSRVSPENPSKTPNRDSAPAGSGTAYGLIPLKHLVNHHPDGANQASDPGTIMLRTSVTSNQHQTFENYGDLDAMQQVMIFGYVDDTARLVHSVPVEVNGGPLGRLTVVARSPRAGTDSAPDVPSLRRTPEGVELRHLTFRPGNRGRVRDFLAMAVGVAGLTPAAARQEADRILDRIAAANVAYLTESGRLAQGVPGEAAALIRQVSRVQVGRLRSYAGNGDSAAGG